jgi:hypothetical protein
MPARFAMVLSWVVHGGVLLLCLTREPRWPASLIMSVAWAVSALGSLWLSKGRRKIAGVVLLLSAALAWNTFLHVGLSLACGLGDCV